MLEKTLKKLFNRKRTYFGLSSIGSAILKGDLRTLHTAAMIKRKQTAIADGDPMDIGSQILERSLPVCNRLAMHDPLLRPDLGRDFVKEFQVLQLASEGCSKQLRERAHGQEEPLARR